VNDKANLGSNPASRDTMLAEAPVTGGFARPSTVSTAPIRAPDLAELETLVVCASEGTFGAAAEALEISRPAVAKRVSNLEALAGTPLFERSARGIRLTNAGAGLLAGARRILDERDLLMDRMREIRGNDSSAIAGLRRLLGHAPELDRAAARPEARLSETERVLEHILRASATAVTISDPDTAVIHEVNDAFCRFVGRGRSELVGKRSTDPGAWWDVSERPALIDELRDTGSLERVLVRVQRPDGTMRVGETSAVMISLAGSPQIIATTDDVTERRRAELERTGTIIAFTAITGFAIDALRGGSSDEALAGLLAPLRECGEFTTALLWELDANRPGPLEGEPPWPNLAHVIERARPIAGGRVLLLTPEREQEEAKAGFAIALPAREQAVVLLSPRALPPSAQALIASMLTIVADVVSAAGA